MGLLLVDASECFPDKLFLEVHVGSVDPCDGSVPVQYSPVAYFGSRLQFPVIKPIRGEAHNVLVHTVLHFQ